MTDEDIRAILRDLRDEPVPADSLARVRLRVAERSRVSTGMGRFVLAWKCAGMYVAMALVALVVVLYRPAQQSTPRMAKVQENVTKSIATSSVPVASIVPSEHKKKVRNRRSVAIKREAVVVRIETADPDVVILLIGD